jgi:hypothetical protein
MITWHKFWYAFWRAVGSIAFGLFHTSQTMAHKSYLKGGKRGRRARRPLTAIYRFVQSVKAKVRGSFARG